MPPMKLIDLNQFCNAIHWFAEIDGDLMIANLFEKATGLFMGVIAIC